MFIHFCFGQVNIRFRNPRNPVIGDKFSSRHGQKGVCSQLWPDIDMPFSGATGMRPDLIINPHAFPSRMTIAMLLESVAAKVQINDPSMEIGIIKCNLQLIWMILYSLVKLEFFLFLLASLLVTWILKEGILISKLM